MYNLRNEADKQRERTYQNRDKEITVRRFRGEIKKELLRYFTIIKNDYAKKGKLAKLEITGRKHKLKIKHLLEQLYIYAMKRAYRRATAGRKARDFFIEYKSEQEEETSHDEELALLLLSLAKWRKTNADLKAETITETNEKIIKRIVEKGIEEGLTKEEIIKEIELKTKLSTTTRSNLIAQVETYEATNLSTVETVALVAGATSIIMKEWVARNDDKTRPTHRQAHGQNVLLGDKFKVGSAYLSYPNDSSCGVPEEYMNCRCCLVYNTKKRKVKK